jgi:ribosome-associated protein
MDVEVNPALRIPASELAWRFSRSPGPGGQHVNTSDSRVELSWDVQRSAVLTEEQRDMLLVRLRSRLVSGVLTVASSAQRSQLRNRENAMAKLAELVSSALVPETVRRATKPTRGSGARRLKAKQLRSETKKQRRRPPAE